MNISVERKEDGAAVTSTGDNKNLVGYIRIRSKTQGIALSLGDRITAVQRVTTFSDKEAGAKAKAVAAASR